MPNTVTVRSGLSEWEQTQVPHPLLGMEVTDKGIALLEEYVAAVREAVGMEVPLSMDHLGHLGVHSIIRLRQRTAVEQEDVARLRRGRGETVSLHGVAFPAARQPPLPKVIRYHRHRVYRAERPLSNADTWYPSWAANGNLYSRGPMAG